MTEKEKARAYDKAIEKIKYVMEHGVQPVLNKEDLQSIFPEIFESEDERIRKSIIAIINNYVDNSNTFKPKMIAWLENQSESDEIKAKEFLINKGYPIDTNGTFPTYEEMYNIISEGLEKQVEKPQGKTALEAAKEEKVDNANKDEPKFHEGDWVVKGDTIAQILDIQEQYYVGLDINGKDFISSRFLNDDKIHLWTIRDAKDGDVLVSQYNKPFIYNGNLGSFLIGSYCGISTEGRFNIATEKCRWTGNVNIHPATKEQRDVLFAKMKEAGYEWDSKKKRLKRIEKQDKQESKWTDEDEKRLQSCIIELQGKGLMGGVDTIDTKWLKSLKQRIHASSAKTCKNDTILDLLQKMPSCITVDGIDYHFVLKKTIAYMAFYEGEGEGSGKVIFWMAGDPIDLLMSMLKKLKEEGLLE